MRQQLAPQRYRIHVDGIVQGVGFRPFIYRLAVAHGLAGWVRNSSRGVDIEVVGPHKQIEAFIQAIRTQAPPLACITRLTYNVFPLNGHPPPQEFVIIHSQEEQGFTFVSPDVATCSDCLRELFDPEDRRYRYPFINCTNCGPRFSIIKALPYDRPNTTMAHFVMCPDCQAEYDSPLDRRFHAQPNACPQCGPYVWLETRTGSVLEHDEGLHAAAQLLREGNILAIKGLGGFHLACDATDANAVARLRQRKHRPHKPLALMMRDMEMVRHYCEVEKEELELLTSPAAPIVLLRPKPGTPLTANIAPGQRTVGVMLPYTPLHHLLLREVNRPLVMTSGNRQNEPIARTNEEAREKLTPIVDGFLWHNRPIHNRVDDSVWMVAPYGSVPLRRSRGYAPSPILLHRRASRAVLATGSQMKNTFCLLVDDKAFLSQHIGEMDYLSTWEFFVESVSRFQELFGITPDVVAHDMHPGFTLAADHALTQIPGARHLPRIAVQHHHAHVVACMAENHVDGPVLGVAYDGTGYGPDGTVWGGEILLATPGTYQRLGHIGPFVLPGSEAAIREPWRIALALLQQTYGELPPDLDVVHQRSSHALQVVQVQVQRRLNAPQTSSCGRLFDAISALLGVRTTITYEGQAAIELETLAATWTEPVSPYPVTPVKASTAWQIPPEPVIEHVVRDLRAGIPRARIARRFHKTIAWSTVHLLRRLRDATDVDRVVLSGGCFQNRLLLADMLDLLDKDGFEVFTHHLVPPNDGGISLGQAVIAAYQAHKNLAKEA